MAKSSLRADSMSKPEQKMFNDTSSGIDKSGLDAKRHKNLAQAAPIDSFSNCSKSRMSIGREFMHLMRERVTKVSSKLFPITVHTFYREGVPLFRAPNEREKKQFPPQYFLCHAWDYQARTQFLKFSQMVKGMIIDRSREGLFPNHGYKAGVKFITR